MGSVEAYSPPADAGQRLMSSIIEHHAKHDPQRVFMAIPKTSETTDGLRDITYETFNRAIDRCAWWLEETLGKGHGFPTIATYLNPMDFRHAILIWGAQKSGYKMFYSSPRNRPDVQVALLEKLQCEILLTPEERSQATKDVLERRAMRTDLLPDLEWFLHPDPVERYPYDKTWEEARKDPYVVMHSSGTTGTPKILVMKQGTVAAHDAFQNFPKAGEAPWYGHYWTGKRVLTSFPWVHAGGVLCVSAAIYNAFTLVIGAEWPLSGAVSDYLHVNGNVQAAWYSPSVLLDIARHPKFLENIANLEHVSYAGGILPEHVGEAIMKHTRLFGTFASTETGIMPGQMPPVDAWGYYKYNPRVGAEFKHFAGDLYELVFTRDKEKEPYQGVFYTFLDADSYSMRDLYIQHPERPGWWRSSGRVDDVVVFADAKKLNAIPYESVIEEHPGVATALICGTGRTRPAVLVQPSQWLESPEAEAKLLDDIWPSFDRANEAGPVFGRLIRELVVFTHKDKPMARAGGKDTVQRKRSLELYDKEINAAYNRADAKGLLHGNIAESGQLL